LIYIYDYAFINASGLIYALMLDDLITYLI